MRQMAREPAIRQSISYLRPNDVPQRHSVSRLTSEAKAMDLAVKYQQQLLDQARQIYRQTPMSDATAKAYLTTPRHLFVRRYRETASKDWCQVKADNLHEHLATLYGDSALTMFGVDDDQVSSLISQPSLV